MMSSSHQYEGVAGDHFLNQPGGPLRSRPFECLASAAAGVTSCAVTAACLVSSRTILRFSPLPFLRLASFLLRSAFSAAAFCSSSFSAIALTLTPAASAAAVACSSAAFSAATSSSSSVSLIISSSTVTSTSTRP